MLLLYQRMFEKGGCVSVAYQNGKTFFACGQPVVVRLADGETHIFSTDGERLSTEDMSFGTLFGGGDGFLCGTTRSAVGFFNRP